MDNALIDDRRIHVDFSQSVAKLWSQYRRRGQETGKGRRPLLAISCNSITTRCFILFVSIHFDIWPCYNLLDNMLQTVLTCLDQNAHDVGFVFLLRVQLSRFDTELSSSSSLTRLKNSNLELYQVFFFSRCLKLDLKNNQTTRTRLDIARIN